MTRKTAETAVNRDDRKSPHGLFPLLATYGEKCYSETVGTRRARPTRKSGRTRLLNYFAVNGGEITFVDLPGYGFAKAAKSEQAKWGALAEGYLSGSARLKNVFVLLDVRHNPTDDDKMLLGYLYAKNIPFTVIATKCDKLSRAQAATRRREIANEIGIGVMNVYLVSSLKRTGKEEILNRLDEILG